MAAENMGDISFSLTLKSRVEDETKKIISELNKLDATGKRAQDALNAIRDGIQSIGSAGGKNLEKINKIISELEAKRDIAILDGGEVQKLNTALDRFARIKGIIGEISNAGKKTSIFPNDTAKEVNEAEKAVGQLNATLSELRKTRNKGIDTLGSDMTRGIQEAIIKVKEYRDVLDKIRSNGGTHPITGLTASDITKSFGFQNVVDAAKTFAREIKQEMAKADASSASEYERKKRQSEDYLKQLDKEGLAIQKNAEIQQKLAAQQQKNETSFNNKYDRTVSHDNNAELQRLEREAKVAQEVAAKKEQAEAQEYERKKRQQAATQAQQDAELKSLDAYIQRYMVLVEARRAANEAIANKASDFVAMQNEAQLMQEQVKRERELVQLKNDIIQRNNERILTEERLAAINRENAASEISWQEKKSKAFSEAIKKQMEASVAAEKTAQVSLFSGAFDSAPLEKRLAQLKRMKEIQEQLAFYQPKVQYAWLDYETARTPNTLFAADIKHKEADWTRLKNIIAELEAEFEKLGGTKAFYKVDDQIKGLEQTLLQLKDTGSKTNLGKALGLENGPTDEFQIAKKAATAKEEHTRKQNELTAAFEKYFQAQERVKAAEERLAAAIAKTNQARQEAIAESRKQAESLVASRVKELEAQRSQLQSLYSSGKSVLSVDELNQIRAAFSQITHEINTLRSAMNNLGSYSIKELFSMGRGTSNYGPLISNMNTVVRQKKEAVELEIKHQKEVSITAAKVRNELASALDKAKNSASGMNSALQDIKSLFIQGGLVYGAQQFLMSIIQTGGELERQHIALQSILGDMQNADTMYGQIKQLALQSPFTFSELNKDVKQLAAYGVEYDQLYDTTKRLADMASGLGVSFERIALAFGQVQARGWLDGKELRQISYAGIPLLDKLSKMYSEREGQKVSTSEVKTRISSRQVSFEDVKSVFWDMTDAGGQFYNMQDTLSNTLLGRFNKLKDAWEIMLSDFASGTSTSGKMLMGVLDTLTAIVQGMHSLGPVLTAALSGFAIKKILSAQSGGLGAAITGTKSRMADGYAQKIVQGQQLSNIERNILATKNQVTSVDLRHLAINDQLTQSALNRLRVEGSITAEQYKMYSALVKQRLGVTQVTTSWRTLWATMRSTNLSSMWSNFSTMATASFGIVKAGIASLGTTLWTAIGGLPGLLISGISAAVAYFMNASAEIKSEMQNISSELKDRSKSISDVLKNNPASEIISRDDLKEIDNAIETYKEKIKEIAPYNYNNLVMSANERSSHKERLAYLSDELKMMKRANLKAQNVLAKSSSYEDLKDKLEDMSEYYDKLQDRAKAFTNIDPSQRFYQASKGDIGFKSFSDNMAAEVKKSFGDIANDKEAMNAAQQAMTSIMTQMEIPQDKADYIRASVLNSFGLTDGWLQDQVTSKMNELIAGASPLIANKIRSHQPLTDAERTTVRELMQDAEQQLVLQYPDLEKRLQGMLDASQFTAVIKLVVESQGDFNGVEQLMSERLNKNVPLLDGTRERYLKFVNSWGKSGSYYDARNQANQDITTAKNNYLSAKRSNAKKSELDKLKQDWDDAKDAAKQLLNYDFDGENKKSNKDPKNKTHQEDAALKAWQERLSSYKSARQAYQKYKQVMGEDAAKTSVEELFDNIAGLDLDKYEESIKKLETELDFSKSAERKKALNSLKRELADWRFSEVLKPEFDRAAALFKEALEEAVSQFDLYDELVEKTGDKSFAMRAFNGDGQIWTDKTRNLAAEYTQRTGRNAKIDATISDTELEHQLKEILGDDKSYELIKKIKDLLKGDYVTYLKKIAEARGSEGYQTLDEKLTVINAEYDKLIDAAKQLGDGNAQRILGNKRNEAKSKATYEELKNSTEYTKFFSSSIKQGVYYLKTFANALKDELAKALMQGGITAEEYASEIEKINDRMNNLGGGFDTFGGGGLSKLTSGLKDIGKNTVTDGTKQFESYKKAYNQALGSGDTSGMTAATEGMQAGQSMMDGGAALAEGAGEMEGAIAIIDTIIHGINDMVQGMYDTFKDIKETAEALGTDTDSDDWSDANTFFSSFSSASDSATKGWDSLKEGNMGGVISGVVGSFTGWIKGFAQGHDQKLDNQIKIAERQEKLLQNISSNVSDVVSNTLGGIYNYKSSDYTNTGLNSVVSDYEKRKSLEAQLNGTSSVKDAVKGNLEGAAIGAALGGWIGTIAGGLIGTVSGWFGSKEKKLKKEINKLTNYSDDTYTQTLKALDTGAAYDVQLASLLAQRDQISKKIQAENDKKDSDSDKIADYEKEQEDLRLQIENFTTNWLSSNYGVDLKDWASQLTDALVDAWASGEDAADAYFDTVNSLMKSLAKKIISQSILETNLQPVLNEFSSLLQTKSGMLDKTDLNTIWAKLMDGMDNAIDQTESFLDYVKSQGLDLSDNGTLSTTNSIKSVTEETADLLASYINAIRLDVSVNRANIQTIVQSMQSLPELNTIANAQLSQLTQIVQLATLRNEKLDDMYDWMRATTTGIKKIHIA